MGLRETTRRLYGRVRGAARSYLFVGIPDHPENGGLTGDRRAETRPGPDDRDEPREESDSRR